MRWAEKWIDPKEITASWDAGWAWQDVERVSQLRHLGMTPETMDETINGRTVISLLKSGQSHVTIALQLRRRKEQRTGGESS